MKSIPHALRPVLEALATAFTRPTFVRVILLLFAAVLAPGRRTVSNLLRTVGPLALGHPSSYHRVFSRRRWRSQRVARAVLGLVLARVPANEPVRLVADDTVEEHRGPTVYGQGRHRDPVRSTHSYITWRWGHLWVVLAVLVRVPGTVRHWALPCLVALYHTPQEDERRGRRHKTPNDLLRQMLCLVLAWFPERRFVLAVDGAYASHALACFARRRRRRLTLVSRLPADAALYAPPPKPRSGARRRGRPPLKGPKLPAPSEAVKSASRTRATVAWYGGSTRTVDRVSGTGCWYKAGRGAVAPVRWVCVEDPEGVRRPEYFFCTAPRWSPERIVREYTGRWNIETAFQEVRAHLGFGTTRARCPNSVLREAPALLLLYTLVVLVYLRLSADQRRRPTPLWPGKRILTFSDALTAVRRLLWQQWLFPTLFPKQPLQKIPRRVREVLLQGLAPAA